MAIRNDLNRLNQTHEKVRKRDELTQIVGDTLFGLLDNEHNAINIGPGSESLFDHIANASNITTDITNIGTDIRGGRYTYVGGGPAGSVTYNITSQRNTENTLQQVERAKNRATNDIDRLERQNAERSTSSSQRTTNNETINKLNTDISEYDRVVPLLGSLQKLQLIQDYYGTSLGQRKTEFEAVRDLSREFKLTTNSLPPVSLNLGGNIGSINLESEFHGTGTTNIEYSLAGQNGEEISDVGNLQTQINGQTVTIKGLSMDNRTGVKQLNGTNIQIKPLDNLSRPVHINLHVKGRITDPRTGVNLDHYKQLRITVNQSNLDVTKRKPEVINYNNLGTGNRITDRLETSHTRERYKRERDALIRAVKKDDGPKYDKYLDTPEKQEAFYQRIRKVKFPGTRVDFFEYLDSSLNLKDLNNFAKWFADDERKRNKDIKNVRDIGTYRDFIHNELENKVGEYFDSQLDSKMINDGDVNMFLKSELTQFATEVDQTKEENNTHVGLQRDLSTVEQIETTKKDENYIRFFKGSSWKTEGETVDLNMNRGPEDINNPEPLKYDMSINVKGINNTHVEINIEGQKPIPFTSGNPRTIINNILKTREINHGSARVHMAYNVMKGFVEMAKSKGIDLTYFDNNTHLYHQIDIDKDGNLIVRTKDRTGTHFTESTEKLFDYKAFETNPSFDDPRTGSIRGLRQGVDRALTHFNHAMNGFHEQYREANRRSFWKKSKNRFHFPKLKSIGGMEFSTNVSTPEGEITITCKGNMFSLSGGPLKKEIQSKDLGKLMNKKVNGQRIFDGVELDALEKIYTAMIEKLREQKHIQKTNFGVRDPRTGKLYILNKNGDFGVMLNEEVVAAPHDIIEGGKNVGQIKDSTLSSGMTLLDEQERKNLLRNPELMYRLLHVMGNRTKFFNLKNGRMINWWKEKLAA